MCVWCFMIPSQTSEKREHKSLTRPPWFTGPYATSVGGTIRARPEIVANISGGGFSIYFNREDYQNAAVTRYLRRPEYLGLYTGVFKCVRCRNLVLFLTLLFVQPSWSSLPRRLRASRRLPIHHER